MKFIILTFKGVLIGLALIIPGISAGTMALITGLYTRLIYFLSSFKILLFKNKDERLKTWKEFYLLSPVFLGSLGGLLLGVSGISFLIQNYSWQVYSIFSGVILGSIPFLIRQIKISRFNTFIFMISAFLTLGLSFASLNVFSGYLWLFLSVYVATGALLLPGVSGSYILMVMGTYPTVLSDLTTFNGWKISLYILVGFLSLTSVSKLIHILLKSDSSQTMTCLTGMTLGGGLGIFLFTDQIVENLSLSLLFLILSFAFIWVLQLIWNKSRFAKRI